MEATRGAIYPRFNRSLKMRNPLGISHFSRRAAWNAMCSGLQRSDPLVSHGCNFSPASSRRRRENRSTRRDAPKGLDKLGKIGWGSAKITGAYIHSQASLPSNCDRILKERDKMQHQSMLHISLLCQNNAPSRLRMLTWS